MYFVKSISFAIMLAMPVTIWAVNPWEYAGEERQNWFFEIGVGAEYEPAYAGSDEYATEAELEISATYLSLSGHRYFIALGEIGAHFQIDPDLVFTSLLEYEEGRDDENDDTLTGFDEVEDTLELQLGLTKRWDDYFGSIAVQYDILDEGKGLVWFTAFGKQFKWSDTFSSLVWLDISGADSEHMRTEFGIKASESAATGLVQYRPGSGLKSASLNTSSRYEFSENWSLGFEFALEYYLTQASDSPLISAEGDDITYEAGITINYEF